MTIALGILSVDGVVIAADTQETAGFMKADQSKILTFLDDVNAKPRGVCAIAGAGDAGYIDALTLELGNTFLDQRDASLKGLHGALETRLGAFYHKHVLPFAAYPEDDRPAVALLLGVQRQAKPHLLITDKTTIRRPPAPFAAIGTGSVFAKILLTRFWAQMDVNTAQVLAAYVVFMVKDAIEGCGKYTDVATIHGPSIEARPDGSLLHLPEHPITHLSVQEVDDLERLFRTSYARREKAALFTFIEEYLAQAKDTSERREDRAIVKPSASPKSKRSATRSVPRRSKRDR